MRQPKVQMNKTSPILHVKMNNLLKELLLDNTLFKVQNQALGDRNPKWKERWQIVQKFIEEQIVDNMELACFNEQNYQLELQTYQNIFLDFKYEPLSFVSMEIGTNISVVNAICGITCY